MYAKKKYQEGVRMPKVSKALENALRMKDSRRLPSLRRRSNEKAEQGGELDEVTVTAKAPTMYEKAGATAYSKARSAGAEAAKSAYMSAATSAATSAALEALYESYQSKRTDMGLNEGIDMPKYSQLSPQEKNNLINYFTEAGIIAGATAAVPPAGKVKLEESLDALVEDEAQREKRAQMDKFKGLFESTVESMKRFKPFGK